ncbi:CalY family protein [Blastococcus sp. PRF04-17]|uniref:CalY family protein n=1 Tax=Blastococcus sp. PRF04-17 TaxID=2933797 RepID=UPI001FF2372C|nr:CalY family protein [Blastococcus sp. PRF04-17]UOY03572.1 CalY family protein [Blastococcus sp. PRF04-17]
MSTKTTNSATARKVVGSLGVIGAAAAVAGMGTFGSFTDSTTPVNTTIESGTLDINLTQQGFTVPLTTAGFVPGDSLTRAVNLINAGNVSLSSVTLNTTVATPSVLTTDVTNGLQMAVKSCSVPWTQGGTSTAATYTCGGTERVLASGPAVSSLILNNPASLAAGATDYLTFSISLPASADNTFQGRSAELSLTFIGSQRTGTAR